MLHGPDRVARHEDETQEGREATEDDQTETTHADTHEQHPVSEDRDEVEQDSERKWPLADSVVKCRTVVLLSDDVEDDSTGNCQEDHAHETTQ